jgi:hypothetical protein
MLMQNNNEQIECIGRGYLIIQRTKKQVQVKAWCQGRTKYFTCVSFAREWVQNLPANPYRF